MSVKENAENEMPRKKTRIGLYADPPEIVGMIPGDGRIRLVELNKPTIKVTLMELKEGLFGGGVARVMGNRVGEVEKELGKVDIPEDFSDFFPVNIDVPNSLIPDDPDIPGPTEYYCRFHIEDGLGIEDSSTPMKFFVDKNPPYYVKKPFSRTPPPFATFANQDIAGGEAIDDAWAAKYPDGLVVNIPINYPNRAANDEIIFCIANRSGTTTSMPEYYRGVVTATADPAVGEFKIPLAKLKTLPNGGLYHRYRLHDAPQNISQDSVIAGAPTLPIKFLPPPVLKPLRVPAAGPNHTEAISLGTFLPAGKEIFCEFDYPDNGDPKDLVTITVRGDTDKVLGSRELGASATKFEMKLTYEILDEVTTGATAEKTVEIEYSLKRGADPAIPYIPPTTIFVNFVFPGVPPDTLPELDNDNLLPVEVHGRAGGGDKNHLTTLDIGQPVRFTATRWTGAPDLLEDALVTFYWDGEPVGTAEMKNTDATVFADVAYELIFPAGLGDIEAYYTLEYPGNPNVMRQVPAVEVLVETFEINLDPHKGPFIELGGKRYITCKTMVPRTVDEGVVAVPPLKVSAPGGHRDLPVGRDVTMQMLAWKNEAATDPIADVTFTKTEKMPVGGGDLVFDMEYLLFKTIQQATPPTNPVTFYYAQIWYEIKLGGTTFESDKEMHPVRVRNSSLQYCEELGAGSEG
ncbi:hypothetical protein [Pseudomonas arsenicoxydans]|uniref:Uncharacterized protein n=1 Tax=Pseudomonas arsenicoxydans TaxID=702115 RepID=A0A502HKN5_9PSED|nr:hypothetical protein [Pseudomonas arsenicoxydans]TPG75357.1 hypothetical protein EAH78_21100 [Pseudomonas arsenicoxydans]